MNFKEIPNDIRVPLAYIEIDNSRALSGLPSITRKVLLLGQQLATGEGNAGQLYQVPSVAEAERLAGRGSMLANMVAAAKNANRLADTWIIGLADDGAGTAATGSITFTGPATAAGTIALMIAGVSVQVLVSNGDTADAIATAAVAAITANTALPVTAAVDGVDTTKVNITARHKGESGNDIDLRVNYYDGEKLPAGVGAAIVGMATGATNPDITAAITAMGDEQFETIVMPWTDAANLTLLETELADRWTATRNIPGMAYCAFRDTFANSATFGTARNSQYVSCQAASTAPQPAWIWAAVTAMVAESSLSIDPARPLQTLMLPGILPPAVSDRFTLTERNTLLHDGMSTNRTVRGTVQLEAVITMYQVNAQAVADTSYLYVNTLETLAYFRAALAARIVSRFPRFKLAADGTRFNPGQPIVTPSIIKHELVAFAVELEGEGLVEDSTQFATDLIVEIDAQDASRINVLASPNLVNQLRIFASQIQFLL